MPTDPYAKRLLWFVFMGSKGGLNRIRFITLIRNKPLNANQIAKEMNLDYKAVQHHVGVLEKNNMITRVGDKYGATFFISTFLEVNLEVFDEIVSKLEKST
jgi:predicted transcriptional regulator